MAFLYLSHLRAHTRCDWTVAANTMCINRQAAAVTIKLPEARCNQHELAHTFAGILLVAAVASGILFVAARLLNPVPELGPAAICGNPLSLTAFFDSESRRSLVSCIG